MHALLPVLPCRRCSHYRLPDPEVKDIDFMHVPGQEPELLASVGEDGSCIIWQLQMQHGQPEAQQLTQLEPPKSE